MIAAFFILILTKMQLFKSISSFIMDKVIHIFDMDDTIFETPTFAEMVSVDKDGIVNIDGAFSQYFVKVKSVFWDNLSKDVYFKRSGDFIVPINKTTNNPFSDNILDYFNNNPEERRMLLSKDGVAVLNSFPGFHKDPDTLGLMLNDEVMNDYENAENRMILTGRDEELRDKIMRIFKYIGFPYPNKGLYLYTHLGGTNIQNFKIKTILNSIKENGWDTVHFYEDRLDWLNAAKEAVNQVYPSVNFVSHFITNIKNKRSL